MQTTKYQTHPGHRYPGGAAPSAEGVNFSVFSRHATQVELLLFEDASSSEPFQVIPLEAGVHRTFYFWHVFVIDLPVGTHYAWRIDGPDEIKLSGFRFNREKVLLDPWARAVSDKLWVRRRAELPGDNCATAMRAVVVDNQYDWEGDENLFMPREDTIIYEMHVGGFTRHPAAGVSEPGTFRGLLEKIPYLKQLGITHVELLPVMAFDEQDVPSGVARRGLKNYWGYSTHSFYSPHPGYCVTPEAGTHLTEFRDMVKALHKAGIGVILDVVFNHTAEGGAGGPTISFKGIGNETFYHLNEQDRSRYRDYTGCGNTVNCNHPIVAQFITQCLEYWVREMHVDGFRFDLASVLSRGENGEPMYHAPVLWSIEFSDVLAYTQIIAEAWDAGGLYQVGDFPGYRWGEWNGRYRDVMRRFVRGDKGLVGEVATRLTGSSDLYQWQNRLPINSTNFITCHDGFTLQDLVSYNNKHNQANGESNRDGTNNNLSWNCGVEGLTNDPIIQALRRRQTKNFMALLLLSQGVPMLLAGDEVRKSQNGNNNAYCQDNLLSWFDWDLVERNTDMLYFTREMIAFRRRHPSLRQRRFLSGEVAQGKQMADITWHGNVLNQPPWDDEDSQILAYTLAPVEEDEAVLHIMLNMSDQVQKFALPHLEDILWYEAIDTGAEPQQNILPPEQQKRHKKKNCTVQPHSVVVLEGRF